MSWKISKLKPFLKRQSRIGNSFKGFNNFAIPMATLAKLNKKDKIASGYINEYITKATKRTRSSLPPAFLAQKRHFYLFVCPPHLFFRLKRGPAHRMDYIRNPPTQQKVKSSTISKTAPHPHPHKLSLASTISMMIYYLSWLPTTGNS